VRETRGEERKSKKEKRGEKRKRNVKYGGCEE
jgi:hypothetical protein